MGKRLQVTARTLRSFNVWGCPYYNLIDTKTVTKTVERSIPTCTEDNKKFPTYLTGFAHCYNRGAYVFTLKPEYQNNRPKYSITVSYEVYTIEFTDIGRKEIARRYKIHKRNMDRYAKLMG